MNLFVRFQILLLSALSAHELAGGTFVETPNLMWQGFAIGVVLFCVRSIKLEGPALAMLTVFIQSTSHFLLGGGGYQSELRMTLAHVISGVLSYLAISYFEIAQEFITSTFVFFVPARPFLIPAIPVLPGFINPGSNSTFQIRQLTASLKFRGPPFSFGEFNES
jgi:hypothetical protein